jgi:heat shock protein HslJ
MRSKLFLIFLSLLFINSCAKNEPETNSLTGQVWKLVAIQFNNETITISQSSYVRDSSYILRFTEATNFALNTSVNVARGEYEIDNQNISIKNYQESTEVGTSDPEQIRINNLLLTQLVKATKFNIMNSNLVIDAENSAFIFEKID